MNHNSNGRKFGRVSIMSLLILIALAACFFAGRASRETEINHLNRLIKLKDELLVARQTLALKEQILKHVIQESNVMVVECFEAEAKIDETIELGMKASELELKSRLIDRSNLDN